MRTSLDDRPLLHHVDQVRVQYRREAVRDQDRDLVLAHRDVPDRVRDLLLGQRIERGGRLVEDQQAGTAQEGPGDRDPLLLASRQFQAAFADVRVDALGRPSQEVIARRPVERVQHLLVGRVLLDKEKVLPDGAREEQGVLRDQADLPADRIVPHLRRGLAVVVDLPAEGGVQPHHEFHQRRLSRPGRADERDRLARLNVERDPVDGVVPRAPVTEHDLLEPDVVQLVNPDRVLWPLFDRLLHQLVEVFHGRVDLAITHDDRPEVLQGHEDDRGDELHRDELSRGKDLSEDQPEEDEQYRLLEDTQDGPLQECQRTDPSDLLHLQIEDLQVLLSQSPDLGEGQAQAFDEFDVPEGLRDHTRHPVCLTVDRSLGCLDLLAQQAGERSHDQDADHEDRDQQPVLGEGVGDEKPESHDRREEDVDKRVDEDLRVLPHLLQDGQRLAAPLVLELVVGEAKGLLQSLVEDLHAELLDGQTSEVLLERLGGPGDEGDRDRHAQPEEDARDECVLGE
ncbi:hypothetical protein DSECCO2_487940 [anaerobic digester metagenome]